MIITTQHIYCLQDNQVAHIPYENKCPRNGKRGQLFFERRFLFSKDYWISFSKGLSDLSSGFSKGPGSGFFTDIGHFGWFHTGIRYGFSFGRWTGFLSDYGLGFSWIVGLVFFRIMDLVFSGSLDLVFLSDYGLGFSWIVGLGFSFGRWIL